MYVCMYVCMYVLCQGCLPNTRLPGQQHQEIFSLLLFVIIHVTLMLLFTIV
jgi:hypothetical protein